MGNLTIEYNELKSYPKCPDNILFYLENNDLSEEKKDWFYEAMKSDPLRYTFDGGLRVMRAKGKTIEVIVIPIDDPLKDIPYVTFFKSEHGNFHLGRSAADKDDYALLIKLNEGDYKYFQDDHFFLAINVSYMDDKKEMYTLYIAKKDNNNEPPRAQQD